MLTSFFRTVILLFFVILSLRLMGKRQIGELQTSEFIITILLSEIASAPITNPEIPLLCMIVPILLLLTLELLISTALLHSSLLKRLFYGTPSVIVSRGTVDLREMRRNRMEIEELMSELRLQGYSDLSDVNYAILEENGRLSVFPFASEAPLTPSEMNLRARERGIAHLLIADGSVLRNNLRCVGWTRDRLTRELNSRQLCEKDVFLFSVDDAGTVTCIKKEDTLR
jgi:uncharacterized membrane protein YcaP (DUF421 family)